MERSITLPNGARLLTERVPGVRTAALGFFVEAGSRHEGRGEGGAAHFIEHMVFKGSTSRDAETLAREMDAIGGQINAYTTKEYTCFYGRCLDLHLDRCLDLLEDMVFHAAFREEDVALERGVILEEIGMYEDAPEDLCAERLSAAVFRGGALGRPILGKESTLAGMTGEFLRDWQRRNYGAQRLVCALAGSFTRAQEGRLRRLLKALPRGEEARVRPAVPRPAVTVRRKAIEQNHLILAWPGLSYRDEERYALMLLNAILGGGASSRLFQEVREKRGLCYSVYSYISDYADTGLLGIYTAVAREQEAQALETVERVVEELAEHGPTPEELQRTREQARASLLMGLETVQARMSRLGTGALLYGRVRPVEEILAAYDQVTGAQLRELAQRLLRREAASLSAVGRVERAEHYCAWLGR